VKLASPRPTRFACDGPAPWTPPALLILIPFLGFPAWVTPVICEGSSAEDGDDQTASQRWLDHHSLIRVWL